MLYEASMVSTCTKWTILVNLKIKTEMDFEMTWIWLIGTFQKKKKENEEKL